ncbi:MAG: nitroreductase [Bacteroidales bacterium]|nr:nitroreductase [Bacteroidales bacterium]
MKPKNLIITTVLAALIAVPLRGQGNAVTDAILKTYSARMFVSDPVPDSDVETILKAGMKAPSARNLQPWFFTVVKDKNLLKELMPNITDNNILIVISGKEGNWVEYDCGLASGYMYIAAQSLGLGAHIYAGPVAAINTSKREALGIPEGYRAIMVLRVGQVDKNVDAVSAASARKKIEEMVVYK